MAHPTGILFVCLGNICRSPVAKFIFTDLAVRRGVRERFLIDSCGTGGWHAGEGADPRAVAVAARHGLDTTHTARRLDPAADFSRFDYLLAMDLENRRRMLALGAPEDRVRLLRSFDPSLSGVPDDQLVVPDPYYGGPDGFDRMYEMLTRACEGLLGHSLGETC